jgi:hypothetical protein
VGVAEAMASERTIDERAAKRCMAETCLREMMWFNI